MERQQQTATTAEQDSATAWMAIELSSSQWVLAEQRSGSAKVSMYRLGAHDVAGLLLRIERVRRELGAAQRPVRLITCYEAGRDGFWLHRWLTDHKVENEVIDPASLQVDRRQKRAKTDRLDAVRLLAALRAYRRGDHEACRMVRVPSVADEDARRLSRERGRLIKERTALVNGIKAACAQLGIYGYAPARSNRRAALERLREADLLPTQAQRAIARQLDRLELVMKQIDEVEAERDAVLATTEPAVAVAPASSSRGTISTVDKMRALVRLRAIAAETATVLCREVFYRRFDNRRQVAAYVGITASPFASGAREREQGISKAGNRRARAAMIELAWRWLRYQPDSELTKWFYKRTAQGGGRMRRIMIVALARKLLVALWRLVEFGLVPTGVKHKMA